MKPEDLKNIPEEIIVQAVELYQEAERAISRWKVSEAKIPSFDMSETMRFLLTCMEELDFAALIDVMADEQDEERILRFPSRRSLEAMEKKQTVYKYGQLKEAGYKEFTWTEIARLSGIASISDAKKYYHEMKERENQEKDEIMKEERESRLMERITKFLLFKSIIEIKKEVG